MSTETPTLLEAVARVRAACIVVQKTGRNTGINSDYATYVDVWDALKPVLTAEGITVGFAAGAVRKEGDCWIQQLRMIVAHENDQDIAPFEIIFPEGNRGTNVTQRQGMAHTYGKRYALIDYFNVITGDDDDAVRLGQTGNAASAPRADPNAKWWKFCHVPIFDLGDPERMGSWSVLANPNGDGEQTLGDLQDKSRAALWFQHPDHPGLNAWRAELIQARAVGKVTDWTDCRKKFRSLNLPEQFAECTPEQLNHLALELAK